MSVAEAGRGEHDTGPVRAERSFASGELRCTVAKDWDHPQLESLVGELLDPAAALRTLHWGRNYLFVTTWPAGPSGEGREAVVKQFRHQTLLARFRRWRRGSKGSRCWAVAQRLRAMGVGTPAPILWAESARLDGPSYYVCAFRSGLLEARYPLRALAAGTFDDDYPPGHRLPLLTALGSLARRLHENGVWFRDFTSGNVLVDLEAVAERARTSDAHGEPDSSGLLLLDLNRARLLERVSLRRRVQDLGRMPLARSSDRLPYLAAYWRSETGARRALGNVLYELSRRSFLLKNRSKSRVRGAGKRLRDVLLPRAKPHVHLPRAASGASSRDKIVWDRLSDQPHQHASKLEKLGVRVLDAPDHVRSWAAGLPALWRARGLAASLGQQRYSAPVPFGGVGVGLRPWPRNPLALLEAVADLGVGDVLLRCHCWEGSVDAEADLARELHRLGCRITLALPQTRELVRDLERWRGAVRERAERLLPFADTVQIGQAPNRSKWGLWNPLDYGELFRIAAAELRAVDSGVALLGPSTIDFEPLITASLLNYRFPEVRFDGVACLLYVDRRGAPENRQYGYDTQGKVELLSALAQGSRNASGRLWITEVNWPLREGPHAPAGRDVAVDEEKQADYLVRYALLAQTTGLVERIFWWQLLAKGYGLVDPRAMVSDPPVEGLRRRPAFAALRQLLKVLGDAVCEGIVGTTNEHEHALRFRRAGGDRVVVAWTNAESGAFVLSNEIAACEDRDGVPQPTPTGPIRLSSSPIYLYLR